MQPQHHTTGDDDKMIDVTHVHMHAAQHAGYVVTALNWTARQPRSQLSRKISTSLPRVS